MNRNKLIQVMVIVAVLLGGAAWDEAQTQTRPTADQIKRQLLPPDSGQFKTMGVRVRPEGSGRQIPASPREVNLNIPFELNSAEISADALPILRELGAALSSGELRLNLFQIQGHTCSLGDDRVNRSLSQRRAEAVKRYLVKYYGLAPEQLEAQGFGPDKPLASNDTETGRENNRRVTVVNTMRRYAESGRRPIVKVNAVYRRGQVEGPMTSGMNLKEDDDFTLTFEAGQECYVYAYQKDAQGRWQQLFPSAPESLDITSQRNPVQPGKIYRLPETERSWLWVDETKGTEHLVLVAYPTEILKPVQVCQGVLSGQMDYQVAQAPAAPEEAEGVKTMGVKGTRETYSYRETALRKASGMARRKDVETDKLFQWQLSFFHR
jgi:outer membrane protein OmpA-like peptidoglycan-associated protein